MKSLLPRKVGVVPDDDSAPATVLQPAVSVFRDLPSHRYLESLEIHLFLALNHRFTPFSSSSA